jgi:N utilization substance protein B
MGIRRTARERALQALFQFDLNPPENLEESITHFWEVQNIGTAWENSCRWKKLPEPPPPTPEQTAIQLFAENLIKGVVTHKKEIDQVIKKYVRNWDLERLAVVDRNILRLAIYEMMYCPDVPQIVCINEAIEIAKKYSTADSGKFVNGILDKFRSEFNCNNNSPE